MGDEIILYDLPSKQGTSWSLNPWKTRLILNYKSIPYKTQWVEYPSIQPLFTSLSIPANPPGETPYTIPAIRTLDGSHIMNSANIAPYLEAHYPTPALPLSIPEDDELAGLLGSMMSPSRALWMHLVPSTILPAESAEYFSRTRAERFASEGESLEAWGARQDSEAAWAQIEPVVKKVGEVLGRRGGPFVRGKEVSYVDFKLVSFLHFLRRIEEGLFVRVVGVEARLGSLYAACEQWLERQD